MKATADNPLKQLPKITFGFVKYTVPLELAYTSGDTQGAPSVPVTNSADQKFDPPAVTLKINSLTTIQYNIRLFKMEWIDSFINCINKSAFVLLGSNIPANCARINDLGASNAFDSEGREYWQVSISIETSKEPFQEKLLSLGYMAYSSEAVLDNIYMETNPAGGAGAKAIIACKSDIADIEKKIAAGLAEKVQEPQMLDTDGTILAPGESPVYVKYKANYEADLLMKPRISS